MGCVYVWVGGGWRQGCRLHGQLGMGVDRLLEISVTKDGL